MAARSLVLKPVFHRSEISLLWSHEGLEQLPEALWRNFLLDTNVEQMRVSLLSVWQEIITILCMRGTKATTVF